MIDYNKGVYLDSIDEAPSELLRAWRNEPSIRRWCREYRIITKTMQSNWLNKITSDPNNFMFTIVSSGFNEYRDKIVGVCGLTNISHIYRNAEFSIYIGPEYQRKGYAHKALYTLIRFGFYELNLRRIWGETLVGNPGAALYDKLGFIKEGTLRSTYYKDGHWCDSEIYAILNDSLILLPEPTAP